MPPKRWRSGPESFVAITPPIVAASPSPSGGASAGARPGGPHRVRPPRHADDDGVDDDGVDDAAADAG